MMTYDLVRTDPPGFADAVLEIAYTSERLIRRETGQLGSLVTRTALSHQQNHPRRLNRGLSYAPTRFNFFDFAEHDALRAMRSLQALTHHRSIAQAKNLFWTHDNYPDSGGYFNPLPPGFMVASAIHNRAPHNFPLNHPQCSPVSH